MGYWCLYDASGSQSARSGHLSVVSLTASSEHWRAFEAAWSSTLDEFGVEYFRMSEFAHSRDEYSGWKTKYDRRAAFLRRLIATIADHIEIHHMSTVDIGAFRRVNRAYKLSELMGAGHPRSGAFAFSAFDCYAQSEMWLLENKHEAALYHVLEDGDQGRGAFEQFAGRENVDFLSKVHPISGRIRGFEAADFLASEYRKLITDMSIRASMEAIQGLPSTGGRYWDETALWHMCEDGGLDIEKRTR